ncbi:MAG: 16S rRNA (uracil(1498)-N(3))-methyltransferase [Verrucomicrobiota bacterium]
MHRFYIPAEHWNLDLLILDESESHHALDVLRLKQGVRAVVFNGEGTEASVEITGTARHRVELRLIQQSITTPLPCRITLAQAIPKGKNMELILEKATELGAAEIVPLLSERTVIQLDAKDAVKKQAKWQVIAIEACKQCGQNRLPVVRLPQTPKEFFNNAPDFDLMLIASLQPGADHLKNILSGFEAEHPKRPASVLILVGPEGDFTPGEIAMAMSKGCRPITLGPIVLRTETAAIYCLSVLGYELLGL